MIILIGWKLEKAIYAKVKDYDKVTASGQTRSTWGILAVKGPPIWNIWKSKIGQWNPKLFGRIAVIVFNVPFPYIYHFPNFSKSVEPCHWRVTTQFIKFEPVPIYLELSLILFAKFLQFLMAILETNFFKKIQNFFTSFEKCERQTHSLWTHE